MSNEKTKSSKTQPNMNAGLFDDGDAGFVKVNMSVDAFYAVEGPDGQPIGFRGIPQEIREREDEEGEVKQFVTLKATRPFLVRTGEKDAEQRTADNPKGHIYRTVQVGEIIWVDIRAEYRNIVDFVPKATPAGVFAFEVRFVPTKKIPLPKGRSMWKGTFEAKRLDPGQHKEGVGLVAQAPESKMLASSNGVTTSPRAFEAVPE